MIFNIRAVARVFYATRAAHGVRPQMALFGAFRDRFRRQVSTAPVKRSMQSAPLSLASWILVGAAPRRACASSPLSLNPLVMLATPTHTEARGASDCMLAPAGPIKKLVNGADTRMRNAHGRAIGNKPDDRPRVATTTDGGGGTSSSLSPVTDNTPSKAIATVSGPHRALDLLAAAFLERDPGPGPRFSMPPRAALNRLLQSHTLWVVVRYAGCRLFDIQRHTRRVIAWAKAIETGPGAPSPGNIGLSLDRGTLGTAVADQATVQRAAGDTEYEQDPPPNKKLKREPQKLQRGASGSPPNSVDSAARVRKTTTSTSTQKCHGFHATDGPKPCRFWGPKTKRCPHRHEPATPAAAGNDAAGPDAAEAPD